MDKKARLIAFYLPQYHPIPENDKWWGKGFTEWTVVSSAKPMFRGHYQPRIPADLGFYDLRLPEVRNAQAELAKNHGIEGFCYWHYWLGNGKRLLERPFDEVLQTGEPDFPFCLGWANHSWKGVFFGALSRTLIEQTYPGKDDYTAHFYNILPAFEDRRYITVDGKPLFYVLLPEDVPDLKLFVDVWQELAIKSGLKGVYFVGGNLTPDAAEKFGFDAVSLYRHRIIESQWPKPVLLRKFLRLYRSLFGRPARYSYKRAMEYFLQSGESPLNEFPAVVPNWDTSPRLGSNSVILHNSTPELFRMHMKEALQKVAYKPPDYRVIFLKSWNEWAEGNYIEPDRKFGRAYLEVVRDEICT